MNFRLLLKLQPRHLQLCQIYRLGSSWSSKNVRSAFISYFQNEHNHLHVPSSSVIPGKGQGTYFTNAGMNQFKPLFLGTVRGGSRLEGLQRVVNSQKCIRVGGKHNDLDEVGKDLTHHTFFEMLGSWSFGDYFKKEACMMALTLLTEVYGLPLNRLYFTYFGGDESLGLLPDLECRDIWIEAGVPLSRVLPYGMRDNFWDMGETGPCGPCTEIHYDHIGGREVPQLVNADSPDVVEIWNLVFMQYDRKPSGELGRLPMCHVDTGMGLERMTAVLQGSRSNYDTDLFQPIFNTLCKVTGAPGYQGRTGAEDVDRMDEAYRTIADHVRMSCVAVADGLLPGRHGLQHKLRLVINRAIQELERSFGVEVSGGGEVLGELTHDVIHSLGETYPELKNNGAKIREVMNLAAKQFQQLQHKVKVIQDSTPQVTMEPKAGNDGFYRKEIKYKDTSLKFALDKTQLSTLKENGVPPTDDSSKYSVDARQTNPVNGQIIGFLHGSEVCSHGNSGSLCGIILDKTCFYSQSGGQAADTGYITSQTGVFEVVDVQEHLGYVLHVGKLVEGNMAEGQTVAMEIDQESRGGCMRNHSGTHLLSAALRSVLGDTHQLGSDIQPDKFTFDFASLGTLTGKQIEGIENTVREHIQAGYPVTCEEIDLDKALQLEGLVTLEGEDYPSPVRVVRIGTQVSLELCGGTHVSNTGDIGELCVVKLSGVSQGTKRVTCITGQLAKQAISDGESVDGDLTQLISDVQTRSLMDTWTDRVKDINTSLHGLLLPKLRRDCIQERLDRLGEKMRTAQNEALIHTLQQQVVDLLDSSKNFTMAKMTFEGKQMVKALVGIELRKPLVLISSKGKSSIALIAAPNQQSSICQELSSTCVSQLSDFNVKETTVNCGRDKSAVMLSVKGQGAGHKLQSTFDSLADSFR